jgi:serine/threonine protein kinase
MKYQRIEPLGDGAYGVVYLAKDKTNDELVALKVIFIRFLPVSFNHNFRKFEWKWKMVGYPALH